MLRKNKPDKLKKITRKAEYSSKFVFSKKSDHSILHSQKGKMVHVVSSQYDNAGINEQKEQKLTVIKDYDVTKFGVDNSDKLICVYSCSQRTARWPL